MDDKHLTMLVVIGAFVLGLATYDLYHQLTHDTAVQEALHTCPPDTFCYEPYGAPIQAEYVLKGTLVLVRWLPASQMPPNTEAYASWKVDFENNMSVCLLTATPPQQVLGDPRMDALGHELLHCLTGNFHP